jgi:hypothetical protein
MASDTLDARLATVRLEPGMGLGPPSERVEEDDAADHDFEAEPEEPSRFDDPDEADVDQDLDDEDLQDDDGWADEEEEY